VIRNGARLTILAAMLGATPAVAGIVDTYECRRDLAMADQLVHGGRRQFNRLTPGGRTFFFRDGCRALRLPKLVERFLQFLRRIQIVLKPELDSALARFTSFAHKEKSANKPMMRKANSPIGL